jgi:hypothetical protein
MEALTEDAVGGVRRREPLIFITYLGPVISRDDATTPCWLGARRPAAPVAEVPPTDRSWWEPMSSESGCTVDGGAVDGLRRAGVHTTAAARPVFTSSSYSRAIDGGAVEGLRLASAHIGATPHYVVRGCAVTEDGTRPCSKESAIDHRATGDNGTLHLRARMQRALTELASKLAF